MTTVPLGVEFDGASVLVVGGGSVGARKARRFVRAGADVVVVSPAFADADFGQGPAGREREDGADDAGAADPRGTVEFVRAAPAADVDAAADWLARVDPLLVVCATDDVAVNDAFATAARDAGVLRNRADASGSEEAGRVVVPATVEDGSVVVSVFTGGRSPALSAFLRDRIRPELDGAGEMAAITGELRATLKADNVPEPVRRDAVRAVVADARVWKALRTANTNARHVAAAVVDAVVDEQGSP